MAYQNPMGDPQDTYVAMMRRCLEDRLRNPGILRPGNKPETTIYGEVIQPKRSYWIPMLSEVKDVNPDIIPLEDLIGLYAYLEMTVAQFNSFGVDVPDWLTSKSKAVRRTIEYKAGDVVEKKLKLAKEKLQSLKSADEQRKDLVKEIAKLEGQLDHKD